MEYCDLGSLDSAISDGRFTDLVSLGVSLPPVTCTLGPCKAPKAADWLAPVAGQALGVHLQEEPHAVCCATCRCMRSMHMTCHTDTVI